MIATANRPARVGPREVLTRLLAISPGRDRVTSCYLRLLPRDRTGGRYLVELKNRIAAALEDDRLREAPRAVRVAVANDLERIRALVAQPGDLPAARGLAVFACGSLDLFESIPLPRVHRTRLVVDRKPAVRELVALEDALGRVIVVALDRAHARFFVVTPFDLEELPCLAPASTRGGRFHSDRQDAPGFGEHTYHNRIRTERERHYEAVAQCLRKAVRERQVEGIVLAGRERDTSAVARFLGPTLAARVRGTAHINPTAVSAPELLQAADAAREVHDRERDRTAMAQWAEGIGTGWATVGARGTLRALGRGQVRALLVAADATGQGYRCSRTGLLALVPEDCRGQGVPVAVPDIVDDALEEALRQGVEVRTIDDPEAAAELEGFSALLRFR